MFSEVFVHNGGSMQRRGFRPEEGGGYILGGGSSRGVLSRGYCEGSAMKWGGGGL